MTDSTEAAQPRTVEQVEAELALVQHELAQARAENLSATSALLTYHHCGLTPAQYGALLAPIDPGRVQIGDQGPLRGKSFVESWDIRRHLTRVFGFTGWSSGTDYRLAFESQREDKKWEVCYTATVTLTVRCVCGRELTSHADVTAGSGAPLPSRAGAHDLSLKSAVSGALKRAAVNLGDMFGLSLYEPSLTTTGDQGQTLYRAAVGRTLAPPEGYEPAVPVPGSVSLPQGDMVTASEIDHEPVTTAVHAEELSPGTAVEDTPDLSTVSDPGDTPSMAAEAQAESDAYADAADRGELSPEDRAGDSGPAVPEPSAEGVLRDAFPEARQVDPAGLAQRVASVGAMAQRAATTDTLKRLYDGVLPDARDFTAEQRNQLASVFGAAFTRITGGQDFPQSLTAALLGGGQ